MLRKNQMNKEHQLAIGDKLAGHYEIISIVGEDEFEILYLVKDLHMAEQKFVLKELFLNDYSSRNEDKSVQVMAKSQEVFRQTKKDIIAEVEHLKKAQRNEGAKYYGYFEENATVYTIMEFVNSSDFSTYLKAPSSIYSNAVSTEAEVFEPKDLNESIPVDEPTPKEKPKSKIFLKILIVMVVIFLALFYYSYNMIEEEKERVKNKTVAVVVSTEPMRHPPLEDKQAREEAKKFEEEANLSSTMKEKSVQVKPEGASYVATGEMEEGVDTVSEELETPSVITEDLSNLPMAKTYDLEILPTEVSPTEVPVVPYEPNIVETSIPQSEVPNLSLGTRIN
ncbi:MAG: Serine/threonine protein kinase [uncultured Sulfurovum sp.]|uniref:Serine/threonine protein kinase n=1 Tax=uncultured Sulfurovum sp. TaxID=269237 RepID=A0A6S6TJL5_9BACT|nr:MAG: Serine/threonine protein kinase [uncultured Sulfurovum sp.]